MKTNKNEDGTYIINPKDPEVVSAFRYGYNDGFEDGCKCTEEKLGWHPASEVPPIGECGISDAMICIAKDYDVCQSRYYKDSGWDYNVKWWCFPPKED